MLVRVGVCAQRAGEKTRLGLKTVHNVTVHSPLAAVGWPLPAEPPAGAHDDATPFCRAGPVRSRDAGDPLHRPDAADFPAAASAVRQGHPRVLLPSSDLMTLPRSAAQVLSGHVTLEIRCIDRMLLTFRQPRLQYGKGIHGFFCHQDRKSVV